MDKKIRTILFSLLFLVFIIFSPILVWYSLGYTFDFEKKAFVKTGLLYVQTKPPQAQIFLSGKYKKKTDRIFGRAKILRLIPKKYLVEIKKENYLPWKKELEIKEGEVTEVLGIILFPQKINFKELEKKEEFFLKKAQKNLIPCEVFFPQSNQCQNKSYFPKKIGDFEVFLEGKDVFLFSFDKGKEKILENFLGWDEKGEKILLFSQKEIWEINPEGKKLLFRTSEEIQDAVFLNENYVIFALSGKIIILETDTRDKPNLYEIAKFENPKLAVNSKNQVLVLEKDKLFISDPLY
jgi:hypothetical protein